MIHVLFLSTSDNLGGAAKATLKLYKALFQFEIKLTMFVKKKVTSEQSVNKVFTFLPISGHLKFDSLLLKKYEDSNRSFWSLAILPNIFLLLKLQLTKHDIIQLNWINGGFVPIGLLKKIKKPIVWRLSDSWPFTGGCHVPFGCLKYETGCGCCPQLKSTDPHDISFKTLVRKQRSWEKSNLTLVAPSRWMAGNARRSVLFKKHRIVHIPTGVDINLFKPLDVLETRKNLNIASGRKIVLFGAVDATADRNKGLHLLIDALNYIHSQYVESNNIQLVVFGHAEKFNSSILTKFETTFVGMINDSSVLNAYYNAADVYVLPSLLENSPNTVLEAMSTATPVVAFDAGGTSELIEHLSDGYLASPYSTEDLATGVMHILKDHNRAFQMGKKARAKIEMNYDIKKVAHQYSLLYQELVDENME